MAKLIDEFLTEAADREVSPATERLDADVEALLKLGLWVADHLAAAADPQKTRHQAAIKVFADRFVQKLGLALYDQSKMVSMVSGNPVDLGLAGC